MILKCKINVDTIVNIDEDLLLDENGEPLHIISDDVYNEAVKYEARVQLIKALESNKCDLQINII